MPRLIDTASGSIVNVDDAAARQLMTQSRYQKAPAKGEAKPAQVADDDEKPPPRKRGRPRKTKES